MPRVVHFEVPAKDLKKIADFYTNAFGWKIEQTEFSDYWLALSGEKNDLGINGAIYKIDEKKDKVINIIGVGNIEEAIEKVKNNGGEMTSDIMEVPKVGRMAYFKDPEGTMFGMIQPDPESMP